MTKSLKTQQNTVFKQCFLNLKQQLNLVIVLNNVMCR